MDANQGVDFLQRIRPRLAVPVHYDDYRIFRSPLSEFLSAINGDLSGQLLEVPARGRPCFSASRDCCLHHGASSSELAWSHFPGRNSGEPATAWSQLCRASRVEAC